MSKSVGSNVLVYRFDVHAMQRTIMTFAGGASKFAPKYIQAFPVLRIMFRCKWTVHENCEASWIANHSPAQQYAAVNVAYSQAHMRTTPRVY
jgi:hypothetical protein